MESYDVGTKGLAPHLSIGRVVDVNTANFTAHVYLTAGKGAGSTPECAIRAPYQNSVSRSGVIFIPEKDDEVYVDWSFGLATITDYVQSSTPLEGKRGHQVKVTPVRGMGGEDPRVKAKGKKPYRWGPIDLMPGDKLISGKLGNFIAVLSGGLTILKGGNLSQIILSKYRDYVKVVSRNLEVYTDFGVIRSLSEDGVTSLEVLGNQSAAKSNKHKDSGWDYEMRLGGKVPFLLRILKDRFSFSVNEDGHATLKSAKSISVELNSPPDIRIHGDQRLYTDGAKEEFVTGDSQTTVRGLRSVKATRIVTVCSGAENAVVGGPATHSYVRTLKQTIRGTSPTDVDTVGYEVRLAAGDYKMTVGNPLDLGTPAALLLAQGKTGDHITELFSGDFSRKVTIKGDYSDFTLLGGYTRTTLAGNFEDSTVAGNFSWSTLAGNAEISTLAGNLSFTTLAGNAELSTAVGNVTIKALAGKITLQAGTASIEIGPAGIKITNAGVEMMTQIQELINTLTTTTAPGYNGPIATVPQFIQQLVKWLLLKGA